MISEEEVKSMTIALKNRYGLDFTNYEVKSLTRGFKRLMVKNEMHGIMDLWSKILNDRSFFYTAVDELMVNLTEFFRNTDAWLKMKNEIFPRLANKDKIKIWHAGCATGEEVYSAVFILDHLGLLSKCEILATDLSAKALQQASTGKYSSYTMKNYLTPFMNTLPYKRIEDYFDVEDTFSQVKNKYTDKVKFKPHNLVSLTMKDSFDLIFCRNVLIYFDVELKNRVIQFLTEKLNDDGQLILGYYDSIPHKSIDLLDMSNNKTRIYQKSQVTKSQLI